MTSNTATRMAAALLRDARASLTQAREARFPEAIANHLTAAQIEALIGIGWALTAAALTPEEALGQQTYDDAPPTDPWATETTTSPDPEDNQ